MRLLLTGGNGLLGQKLVELLSHIPGIQLYVTGRGHHKNIHGVDRYLSCDLSQWREVDELLQMTAPDYLIHTAAMTQVDECEMNKVRCWENNVAATKYLLAACKNSNIFFQYISSDFVFDGEKGLYIETDPPNPINHYGMSKLAAENLVSESDLKWTIVRTVLVYGVAHEMSRSNLILWVKNSLENNEEIRVVTDQVRTPTLAEDLAIGCKLVLDHKAEGIFHISGEEPMSPYQMALQTADFFQLDASLIHPVNANTFSQPGKRPPRTGFNIKKAKSELGFFPKKFTEGLALIKEQLKPLN